MEEKQINSGNVLALPMDYELQKRYKIGQVLGAGGFGITYKAFDKVNKIYCAVKEYVPLGICVRYDDGINLKASKEEAEKHYDHGKKRFMEEAATLLEVSNIPNIVRVTDFFETNGTAYYVMEYLDGSNLSKLQCAYPDKKIPYEIAVQILYAAGKALDRVHTQKFLLHRDISPENIVITKDARIKLIDFGSAKHISGQGNQHFTVVLKPHFAPPEQYQSNTKQGSYTDVYALASTFYYMITGKKLPDSMERMVGEIYIPAYQLVPQMSRQQSIVLDKALHLDYRKRYRTIGQFLQELKQADTRITDKTLQKENVILTLIEQGRNKAVWNVPENSMVSLGRGKQCDIVIEGHMEISKLHCYVQYDSVEKKYLFKDVSTNGSSFWGRRLKKDQVYILARGSKVSLAGVCEIKME